MSSPTSHPTAGRARRREATAPDTRVRSPRERERSGSVEPGRRGSEQAELRPTARTVVSDRPIEVLSAVTHGGTSVHPRRRRRDATRRTEERANSAHTSTTEPNLRWFPALVAEGQPSRSFDAQQGENAPLDARAKSPPGAPRLGASLPVERD